MRNKIQKVICLMALIFGSVFSVVNITPVSAAEQTKVTIIHTNDVHGYVDVEPYVKGLADQKRADGENVIVISAGDAFAGTPFASLSNGIDVAKVMNAVGYEMMTLGNHEFAMNYDVLREIVKSCEFPVLGLNAEPKLLESIPEVKGYVIKEVNGVRIGFLGLTTSYSTEGNTHGDNTAAMAEKLKKEAEAEGATVFVAVAHLGVTDPNLAMRSTYLAEKCPWLTSIIDAHCHTVHSEGLVHNGVLISETGEYGNNIGVTELTLEDGKVVDTKASIIPIKGFEETCGITPDAEIQKIIDEVNERNAAYLAEVVFTTPVTLVGNRGVIRKQETNFGNIVSDAYRKAGNVDIGFAAAVTIRQDLPAGDVTRDELLKSLGSEQRLVAFNYKGADIINVMEAALATYPEENNSFQHVSGISVQFDPNLEPGSRVQKIIFDDGRVLDPEETYRIITREDMLMQFMDKEAEATLEYTAHGNVYPTFIAYVNSGIEFNAEPAGRIVPVDSTLKEVEHHISVTHMDIDTKAVLERDSVVLLPDEKATVSAKDFKDYEYSKVTVNGKDVGTDTSIDVTYEIDGEVVFYYKAKATGPIVEEKADLTITHYDATTNKVLETEKVNNVVGKKYTVSAKEIKDYTFNKIAVDGKDIKQGEKSVEVVFGENKEVAIYYKPIEEEKADITITYYDATTKKVLETEKVNDVVGKKYTVSSKDIKDYKFDKIAVDGKVIKQGEKSVEVVFGENKEVALYYQPIAKTKPKGPTTTTTNRNKGSKPKTGDMTNIASTVGIFAVSGLVYLFVKKQKVQ